MNTSSAADLSEQMMEWNTPISVVEAVVAGKRASWAIMLDMGQCTYDVYGGDF